MTNCVLIGAGYWGLILKKYIILSKDFKLHAVCDSKSDLDKVWNNKDVGAVVIAVPNEAHYPIVAKALKSGKHVMTEKPLAMKVSQCRVLKKLGGGRVLVDYVQTFSMGLRKAKELVEKGRIGDIKGIEMSVRHLGRFGGGSVYWLLGSHLLSVLDMFIPLKDLEFGKGDMVRHRGEAETGMITFEGGGLRGCLAVSLNYPGKETRIIIYGSKGTIVYDPLAQPSLVVTTYKKLKWVLGPKLPQERKEYGIDESDNLTYVFEHFARMIKGKAEGNVDRAVEVTRVLEGLQS